MTEKQHPRTSFIASSLQKFKRTPFSTDAAKHDQDLIEQNSTQQDKKKPSTKPSPQVNNNNTNKPWRHVSLPLPAQLSQGTKTRSKEKEGERSKSQARLLNFHAPRLSLPLKRSQTATMSGSYSRIPTPTKPPQGDAYSHTVYQEEGRRSVLSSHGRRYTGLQKTTTAEKEQQNNNMERKKTVSDKKVQDAGGHDPCSYPGPGPAAAASSSVPRQTGREDIPNNHITHSAVQNTISRSHTMLPVRESTVPSSSIPGHSMSEQPKYKRRRSLPPYSHSGSGQRPTQTQGGSSALTSKIPPGRSRPRPGAEDGSRILSQIAEYEESEMPRKSRVRDSIGDSSSAQQRPGTNRQPASGTFASRQHEPNRPENQSTAARERSSRRLGRAERMTQRATVNNMTVEPSYTVPLHIVNETERRFHEFKGAETRQQPSRSPPRPLPSLVIDENDPRGYWYPDLEQRRARSPTRFLHQVADHQPRQYWLGRFMTLVNAFHFEDSFNQPDEATGFGMISSFSRPLGSAERLSDYRIKRAFMVLENACVSYAATQSFQAFKNEYILMYGDRWMGD